MMNRSSPSDRLASILVNSMIAIALLFPAVAYPENPEWLSVFSDVRVYAIVDQGDLLWVGTNKGLTRLSKITRETVSYNVTNSGLPDNWIWALAIDGSANLWIGTSQGLARYDGAGWTVCPESELLNSEISAFAVDAQGDMWVGTRQPMWSSLYGGGLAKYDGENWTIYHIADSELPLAPVHALVIDRQGNKWIGTDWGLAKFDTDNGMAHIYYESGLRSVFVSALAMDVHGNLWIGGGDDDGGCVIKFDGTNWTQHRIDGYLIMALIVDVYGGVWIGTSGGGLVWFEGENQTVYNTGNSGLPDNHVNALAIDAEGNKWIGTSKGLVVYREGGVILTSVKERLDAGVPLVFALSQNYPNPFNPTTAICFMLPDHAQHVTLTVYNLCGQKVCSLVDGAMEAGTHTIIWDGKDALGRAVASGVYFYRMNVENGQYMQTRKMVLIR